MLTKNLRFENLGNYKISEKTKIEIKPSLYSTLFHISLKSVSNISFMNVSAVFRF